MGRTIPSFRFAAVMEEKTWNSFKKYLNKKEDKKAFKEMFSVANIYNSASSYSAIPVRIHPIMMSIVLHHYKILKDNGLFSNKDEIYGNNNYSSIILERELGKWKTYSYILKNPNRYLFTEMLQSVYKYSSPIEAKGENYSTESLLMSLIFEQHNKILSKT